jgi:hypothetical protein
MARSAHFEFFENINKIRRGNRAPPLQLAEWAARGLKAKKIRNYILKVAYRRVNMRPLKINLANI